MWAQSAQATMPLRKTVEFPPVESAYTDEFGRIDAEIYAIAADVWRAAGESLALQILNDAAHGVQLMLRAAAKVTEILETDSARIVARRAYLYRSYKNLLLAELEKQNGHHRILTRIGDATALPSSSETVLNEKILVNQLRREMSAWARAVFDLHQLGYSFDEMVPKYGSAANVIRSRYSKEVAKLARKIQQGLNKNDGLAK